MRACIYMTRLTAPAIDWGETEPRLEPFQAGAGFTVGDIEVESFSIPHDAIDPVGFCFEARGRAASASPPTSATFPNPSSSICGAPTCCCSKPITISTC